MAKAKTNIFGEAFPSESGSDVLNLGHSLGHRLLVGNGKGGMTVFGYGVSQENSFRKMTLKSQPIFKSADMVAPGNLELSTTAEGLYRDISMGGEKPSGKDAGDIRQGVDPMNAIAKKIAGLMADSVSKLAEGSQATAARLCFLSSSSVETAENADRMIHQIVSDIKKTTELAQEINAANREQAPGRNRIHQQLDKVIRQHSAVSQEMVSASEELASLVDQLHTAMGVLDTMKTIENYCSGNPGRQNANLRKQVRVRGQISCKDEDFENGETQVPPPITV